MSRIVTKLQIEIRKHFVMHLIFCAPLCLHCWISRAAPLHRRIIHGKHD